MSSKNPSNRPGKGKIFLAYARNISNFAVRWLFNRLRERGYDVFMDIEYTNLDNFENIVLNQVMAREYFLLILAPGTLETGMEEGEWVRREYETALTAGRNVLILTVNDCSLDMIPASLESLKKFERMPLGFEESSLEKLTTRLDTLPMGGKVESTPRDKRATIENRVSELLNMPMPVAKALEAEAFANHALVALIGRDYEAALIHCNESLRLEPEYEVAHNLKGMICHHQGDYKEAVGCYNAALRLYPYYAEAIGNRGVARAELGDYEGALGDYDEVIGMRPQRTQAYYNRARAHYSMGNYDEALRDVEQALHLAPGNTDIYILRMMIHRRQLHFLAALSDFWQVARLAFGTGTGGWKITG